MTGCKEIDDFL